MDRLYVRLPNWVGDVAMATPALRALRRQFPKARIAYGCRPYVGGLIEGLPWHDEILPDAERGALAPFRLAARLKATRFDAALLMTSSFGSALACRLAGIPRRIGLSVHGRGPLLSDALPPLRDASGNPMPDYMGRLYVRLCEAAGCAVGDRTMALPTSPAQEERATRFWKEARLEGSRVVGLVPGAAYGSAKCWPPGHFAALARGLAAVPGVRTLLLFGPGEERIAEAVRREIGDSVTLAGPDRIDLGALKAVVRRLAAAVTNDTGPRHIAEAAGVPVVVLLGPMDPRYTDSGNPRVTVLREPVDCAPCNRRTCPIDHRCLVRIPPERALGAVLEALRA